MEIYGFDMHIYTAAYPALDTAYYANFVGGMIHTETRYRTSVLSASLYCFVDSRLRMPSGDVAVHHGLRDLCGDHFTFLAML